MCGIAGIASLRDDDIDMGLLVRMRDLLKHRGPDDEGIYLSRFENPNTKVKVGLGHRRLSIIDLEGGHQPMHNEDKTVWIIYNGEIYNFPELKSGLIEKGHRFTTNSDTEVIIHLYEEKGVRALEGLRGMFAFALWDAKRDILFLARDRIGKKPLYYFYKDGVFVFASEIKSILEHGAVKREIDLESLDRYLTYGYAASPATMYKDINALEPAHYLIFDGKDIKTERYWNLSYKNKVSLDFRECQERLYDLSTEATKLRLISDVPLGAFLSGGVDSSCIVALMSKLSSSRVKTFSIGFNEKDFDELKYARFIAKRFNTDHRELVVKPDAMDVLPRLAWHYDQPLGDSSAIPSYYVSRMTREFVTVALNGDGGDESFAGYSRYRGVKLARLFRYVPKALLMIGKKASLSDYAKRFFGGILENEDHEGAYITWLNYFTYSQKDGLYTEELKSKLKDRDAYSYLRRKIARSDADDAVEKIIYADINSYLPEDLLVKIDIATMANSLEGRSPFLDQKVMEFAASLPLGYKLKGLNSKRILKKTFSREIPQSFLNRKKRGFGIPVGKWFAGELKSFTHGMLLCKESIGRGLFSKDYIETLLAEHEKGLRDHTHRIYALLAFEMWHRVFIERRPI